jgi:hypothetical protein
MGKVAVNPDLQPSGYQRRNWTGKFSNKRHSRAGSPTFVRAWLRRFIGCSLGWATLNASRIPESGAKGYLQTNSRDNRIA